MKTEGGMGTANMTRARQCGVHGARLLPATFLLPVAWSAALGLRGSEPENSRGCYEDDMS